MREGPRFTNWRGISTASSGSRTGATGSTATRFGLSPDTGSLSGRCPVPTRRRPRSSTGDASCG
jgi:hypothetical protein